MHHHWKIEHWEDEYVYTHIWVAHLQFRSFEFPECQLMGWVAFRAAVAPVLVEVHLFLCAASVSRDSFRYHVGNKGSHPFDFHEAFSGVFLSQSLPCYSQQTQHLTSSLLGFRRAVSWLVVLLSLLRRAKTHIWPFWSYSMQSACRTVSAVPYLLALP